MYAVRILSISHASLVKRDELFGVSNELGEDISGCWLVGWLVYPYLAAAVIETNQTQQQYDDDDLRRRATGTFSHENPNIDSPPAQLLLRPHSFTHSHSTRPPFANSASSKRGISLTTPRKAEAKDRQTEEPRNAAFPPFLSCGLLEESGTFIM